MCSTLLSIVQTFPCTKQIQFVSKGICYIPSNNNNIKVKVKSKAIPVTGREGL
jgi:hypothetical protein